jgi:hypothetical protein
MLKHWFGLTLALLTLVSLHAEVVDLQLDSALPGGLPPEFTTALAGYGHPGKWQILEDTVTPADASARPQRKSVLAQTSAEPVDEHFPICVYNPAAYRDFTFSTRFKLASGTLEQMAGLVFRYQDASNFYVLRVSGLGHNLSFYPMVNGVRPYDPIRIAVGLDLAPGSWHSLGVQCDGINFVCYLDGHPVGPQIHDPTFPAGKVGFWTKSDAVSYFTDATVTYTPRIPAAQRLIEHILEEQPRLFGLRLYTPDTNGVMHVLASKLPEEVGQPGEASEKAAYTDGSIYYGTTRHTVVVVLPLRDRNGDPIAAVRVEMNSFFGETQDTALTRATDLVKRMQEQVTTLAELME